METSIPGRTWRVASPAELGRVLARVRQQAGLSQDEMAARIGAHRPYLSRLEQGRATEQLIRTFAILREAGYEFTVSPKSDNPRG